jgi:hypothetical protein
MIKYPYIATWDYGPTLGIGPYARPTNPHPDSPIGRALQRRGEGYQYELPFDDRKV